MTTTAYSAQGATLTIGTTAAAKNITAISKANPAVITSTGHGLTDGAIVKLASVGGMTQANGKVCCVRVKDVDNFYAYGFDSSGATSYTTGGTATPTACAVGNWRTYNGFNGSRDELDATNLSSVAKEFLSGLQDNGTLDITFHVDDTDDGQNALRANLAAPACNSAFVITFANSKTRTFSGFVKSAPESGGVNALAEGNASIRISGAVVRG